MRYYRILCITQQLHMQCEQGKLLQEVSLLRVQHGLRASRRCKASKDATEHHVHPAGVAHIW